MTELVFVKSVTVLLRFSSVVPLSHHYFSVFPITRTSSCSFKFINQLKDLK